MDDFDRAILRRLQQNNRVTSETLAAAVGLSATACQRRIKRLRESGVIAREIAVLSPRKADNRITLIVTIVLNRGGAMVIDTFKRDMLKIPEVQQCYYVTGQHDFVLIITAKDMRDYEDFTRRVFFEHPSIREFNTTVVMESTKLGLEIPL